MTLFRLLRKRGYLLALYSAFSVLGLATSALALSRLTPMWQASFTILVTEEDKNLSKPSVSIEQIFKNSSGTSQDLAVLTTEAVLGKVYETFLKRSRNRGYSYSLSDFKKWAEDNITIKQIEDSSVLNIHYIDDSRADAKYFTQLIANAVQDYSVLDNQRKLLRTLEFADAQYEIYDSKARESYRSLDAFRLRYGLPKQNSAPAFLNPLNSLATSQKVDPTSRAVLDLDPSNRVKSELTDRGNPLEKLAFINHELIRLSQVYLDSDIQIVTLKKERDALKQYIETTSFGLITLPGSKNLTKLDAQSIIMKYGELQREVESNERLRDSLQAQRAQLAIQVANKSTPWPIVNSVSVPDNPFRPRPARVLLIGVLVGISVAYGIQYFVESRPGSFVRYVDLIELCNNVPIFQILTSEMHSWRDYLKLVLSSCSSITADTKVVLIGSVEPDVATSLELILSGIGISSSNTIGRFSDINSLPSNVLLVVQAGSPSVSTLKILVSQLTSDKSRTVSVLCIDFI